MRQMRVPWRPTHVVMRDREAASATSSASRFEKSLLVVKGLLQASVSTNNKGPLVRLGPVEADLGLS